MNDPALFPRQLTIVGGGITGLAAAYLAAKAGARVTVLEGSPSFGGLLNTFEIGGNRLEFYYHHFFTHDVELRWLLSELDMTDQLGFFDTTMGVFRNGRIYDFNSPIDLLRFQPIGLVDKLRFGLSSLYLGKLAKWEDSEQIPALDWLTRYAGRSTAESLWKPMLDIKFGPYAHEVPLSWMIGRMRQRLGSRQKGDEKLGYLRGSLQVLLDKLLAKLRQMGVELVANSPVEKLDIREGKLWAVETPQGRREGGDFLFTIPTIYLFPLLQEQAVDLAKKLQNIEYFGAVCTVLAMDRPLSEVYWLNVADAGFPFGGVIEHTNLVPPSHYNGLHITYLSRYFAWSEPLAKMQKEEIAELMIQPLSRIYPAFKIEQIKETHVFKTMTAATVCDLNFSKKIPACRTEIEHLFLASMPHIYPDERSTNNAIRVAAEALQSMGFDMNHVPKGSSLSGKIGFKK